MTPTAVREPLVLPPIARPIPEERVVSLLFPHGFGDVVQALPSFARLAAREGRRLSIGVLRRLPACRDLLERQPWCASVFGIADPWNDFAPANTWDGYHRGVRAIQREHPEARAVLCRPPDDPTSRLMAKAVRIAAELGVEYVAENPVPDPCILGRASDLTWAPALVHSTRKGERAGGLAVIHGTSGNRKKDVPVERLEEIAIHEMVSQGLTRPFAFIHLPVLRTRGAIYPESALFHWLLAEEADVFVGVDSGPAHVASTGSKPVAWVFTATPVEQAVPLYRRAASTHVHVLGPYREDLLGRWEAWKDANVDLAPRDLTVYDGGRL